MKSKKIKKWNNQIQEDRKKKKIKAFIFLFFVLFFIFMFLNHHSGRDESTEKDYISCTSPFDITSELRNAGYRVNILSTDSIFWTSFQPQLYGPTAFTDRIQIYSDNSDNISAIRIEASADVTGKSYNNEAKEHFYWVGSQLKYPINVVKWIKKNIDKRRASLMIDKYTKITIFSPVKECRVMDIFKVNDTNKTSPIHNDGLFYF